MRVLPSERRFAAAEAEKGTCWRADPARKTNEMRSTPKSSEGSV